VALSGYLRTIREERCHDQRPISQTPTRTNAWSAGNPLAPPPITSVLLVRSRAMR